MTAKKTIKKENNTAKKNKEVALDDSKLKSIHDLATDIIDLDAQMKKYSEELDFEHAIECRDRIKRIEKEIEFKNGRK